MKRQPPLSPKLLLCAGLSAVLGGCTTVVIHSQGKVSTENHFGILHLSVDPARTSAMAVSSLGAVALPGSFALGYTRWQGVGIGQADSDACLLVNFDFLKEQGADK